jgi:ubiquitin C-terminal hydrolase
MEQSICGLQNVGNTCFLNAVVQVLRNIKSFKEFILTTKIIEGTPGEELIHTMRILFTKMERCDVVIPMNFNQIIQKLSQQYGNSQFRGLRQNDSHELLIFILDLIYEAAAKQPNYNVNTTCPMIKTWNNHFKAEGNFISNHMFCQSYDQIICDNCHHISYSYHPMLTVTLALPEHNCTLEECLDKYRSTQILDDQNRYKCEKCGIKTNAQHIMNIGKSSTILIITLNRFSNRRQKNNIAVDIPRNLTIDNISSHGNICKNYKLIGSIIHHGSTSSGHYIANCLINNRWYICNDEQVTPGTPDLSHPYILFYSSVD